MESSAKQYPMFFYFQAGMMLLKLIMSACSSQLHQQLKKSFLILTGAIQIVFIPFGLMMFVEYVKTKEIVS